MEKFTILEEESGLHLISGSFSQAMLKHKKIIGDAVKHTLFYRRGDHFKWCYKMREFSRVGRRACQKIVNDKKFTKNLSFKIKGYSKELFLFARKIILQNLSSKTNKELTKVYLKLLNIFKKLYAWGLVIEIAEVYNSFFSKFVHQQLEKFIAKKKLKENTAVLLSILTAPTQQSLARGQEKDFLKLVGQIKKSPGLKKIFKKNPAAKIKKLIAQLPIDKIINEHLEKYRCVNYNYEGPALDKKTLIKTLKDSLSIIGPEAEIKKMQKAVFEVEKQQKEAIAQLNPDKELARLLFLAKEFTTLKFIRKESIAYGNYAKDLIFLQACQRFKIILNQARCMMPGEFVAMLEKDKVDRAELKAREKELAYLMIDGQEKIFSGLEARKLSRLIAKPKIEKIDQIQGTVASPGQAKGAVKIITHPRDMAKMSQGDILVASATNPAFLPAMKKAAAIVTDMGGLTCHAAIVSRELHIPCVVGTKIATKVLKDGMTVEVDANRGMVRILK